MSTWGCHAAMLRTLERQPPADEALVGPLLLCYSASCPKGGQKSYCAQRPPPCELCRPSLHGEDSLTHVAHTRDTDRIMADAR